MLVDAVGKRPGDAVEIGSLVRRELERLNGLVHGLFFGGVHLDHRVVAKDLPVARGNAGVLESSDVRVDEPRRIGEIGCVNAGLVDLRRTMQDGTH